MCHVMVSRLDRSRDESRALMGVKWSRGFSRSRGVANQVRHTFLQNKPPEQCSGQFARGTTCVYREFFCCGAQLQTAQFTAASDQTVPARHFNVRGTPRRRRMGKCIRPIPAQRTARRAWARADLGRRDAKEGRCTRIGLYALQQVLQQVFAFVWDDNYAISPLFVVGML
jgi:hypothetical protein